MACGKKCAIGLGICGIAAGTLYYMSLPKRTQNNLKNCVCDMASDANKMMHDMM